MLNLTLWEHPLAHLIGAQDAAHTLSVRRQAHPQAALDDLRFGDADVALIEPLDALVHADTLELVPGVGIVAWRNPYRLIALPGGLSTAPTHLIPGVASTQERFIAHTILREHYGFEVEMVASEVPEGATCAYLIDLAEVSSDQLPAGTLFLDLGQEWYELVNYPTVVGLLAARKGSLSVAQAEAIRIAMGEAERRRITEFAEASDPYFAEEVRLTLSSVAIAGLTELQQMVYFNGITPHHVDLPFMVLESDADAEDDDEHQGADPTAPPGNSPFGFFDA